MQEHVQSELFTKIANSVTKPLERMKSRPKSKLSQLWLGVEQVFTPPPPTIPFSKFGRACSRVATSLQKLWGLYDPTTRRQQERPKQQQIQQAKQQLSTCTSLFCTFLCRFLHDYDVKLPNFTFSGGRKQATTKCYSLSKLEYGSQKFNSGRVRLHLTK